MLKRKLIKKQEAFLKLYGDRYFYDSIRDSCKKANIGKSSFYRWLKENPEFKKKVEVIKENRKNDPFKQIREGNVSASFKFLKKYGKSRGYC